MAAAAEWIEESYSAGRSALRARIVHFGRHFKPKEDISGSTWAERYARLPSGGAITGKWRRDYAPYQCEPLDCMCDRETDEITLLWGAQTGKSTVIRNAQGFYIHWRPRPQLYMAPNNDDIEDYSKEKLEPFIDETPGLRRLVAAPRSRDKASTIRHKRYPGGFWLGVGSNSPRGLRGRSAPIIQEDECDAYEPTEEGDPSELIWRRARTYPDKKRIRATTPTVKGRSRGEAAFLRSDRRRFWVPCPHCGHLDTYRWANLRIGRDKDGQKIAEGSYLACASCDGKITDEHKYRMNLAGQWIAERPFRGHAGFHLPAMASLDVTFAEAAQNFLNAEASGDYQTWTNTDLAETYEEGGDSVDADDLAARLEDYGGQVPAWVLMCSAGVDTQDDRMEVSRWGYGIAGETCLIDHRIIYKPPDQLLDPKRGDTELEDFLLAPLVREDGVRMYLAGAAIDSQGHFYEEVLQFCKAREKRPRVPCVAIRGGKEWDSPLWPLRAAKHSRKNVGRGNVYTIGVNRGKRDFFARLARRLPKGASRAPGYVHLCRRFVGLDGQPELDAEGLAQLVSEKQRSKRSRGLVRRWFDEVHPRHEMLDCKIYADSVVAWRRPNWIALERAREKAAARRVAANLESEIPEEQAQEPASPDLSEDAPETKPQPSANRKPKKRRGVKSRKNWVTGGWH